MTTCHDCTGRPGTGDPRAEQACACPDAELPADAFVALRAASGMLLGEEDFRVLMGNPRGKQMLHTSWLHGRGVVWGMRVREDQPGRLRVGAGLAVDGVGRELRLETSQCLDLTAWATAPGRDRSRDRYRSGEENGFVVSAWVVAEFAACLDRPVPALADPCDVARRHDSYSRVVETVRLTLTQTPPEAIPVYPRVRMLLGLTDPDPDDDAEVWEALRQVRLAPPDRRAPTLLAQFRRLAALDVHHRRPQEWRGGEDDVPHLPMRDAAAGVVLGEVSFTLHPGGECGRVDEVWVDPLRPDVLLPTFVLQDLLCGLAPGLIGRGTEQDAGGPRLDLDAVVWSENRRSVSVTLDRAVLPGSWEGAVEISSLSPEGRGWSPAHIDSVELWSVGDFPEDEARRLVVRLDSAPAYPVARLLIRGTGRNPLVGADPMVPFAGVIGGPPGSEHEGHDAAVMTDLRRQAETTEE